MKLKCDNCQKEIYGHVYHINRKQFYCYDCNPDLPWCSMRQCRKTADFVFFHEKMQKYSIFLCEYHEKMIFKKEPNHLTIDQFQENINNKEE